TSEGCIHSTSGRLARRGGARERGWRRAPEARASSPWPVLLLAVALACSAGTGSDPAALREADPARDTTASPSAPPHPPHPSSAEEAARAAAADVDDALLRHADAELDDWLTYGRTQAEDRFSPLDQIHEGNVGSLGLAWSFETGTTRGLEATPLVHDGVLYATGAWSVVYAVDAATGRLLWRHDPEV